MADEIYDQPCEWIKSDDLYFVSSSDGFIKIGRTKAMSGRLAGLQNGNPHTLTLEHHHIGLGWQEKVWHFAFPHLRQRGEWFVDTIHIRRAIEALRSGEEWIATLDPPPFFAQRFPAFASIPSIEYARQFREIVADQEDFALEAVEARNANRERPSHAI